MKRKAYIFLALFALAFWLWSKEGYSVVVNNTQV